MRLSNMPIALTIAGSDSGGEAGIQADLLTFARLKVHGVCAITCLTAQNRSAVSRIEPASAKMVRAQLEAVTTEAPLEAAKTGMLYSTAIIREVVAFACKNKDLPLVVDPVLISTSGRRLLEKQAVEILRRELLPLATLSTPNVPEAEALLGVKIKSREDARAAARTWHEQFGGAALIKGGHLPGGGPAVDFLCHEDGEWMLESPRIAGVKLHGTGCTYSAAIAAWLARGEPLPRAVAKAKLFMARQIASVRAGK